MPGIDGRTIAVTGAASGIGRATALACARAGATVLAIARRGEALDRLRDSAPGRVIAMAADVRDQEAMHRAAALALDRSGRLDVWVNAAAVSMFGRLEEVPVADVGAVFETNVIGTLHGCRAALRCFREQGNGTLINLGSVLSHVPVPNLGGYVLSKYAVKALSDVLRSELFGERRIKVCTVLPASIDTPIFQQAANYTGRAPRPLRPIHAPEKVARTIVRCAGRPRRQVYVGTEGRLWSAVHALVPSLAERVAAWRTERDHFQPLPAPPTRGNIADPMPAYATVDGGWRARARERIHGR